MPAAGAAVATGLGLEGGAAVATNIGVNAAFGASYTYAVNTAQCIPTTPTDLFLGAIGGAFAGVGSVVTGTRVGKGVAAANTANRFVSGKDEAVFWSGIRRGKTESRVWAANNDGVTLQDLMEAKGVKLPEWDPTDAANMAAWRSVSKEFAAGASGKVRVLQEDTVGINTVWGEVEFPALKANPRVTSIVSVDPRTNSEVTLWTR